MDDQTRFRRLAIFLIEGDYGSSAKEVLQTCALVADYAQEHTPDQVKAFQAKVKINPQVWGRLLALHRDERLKKHLEHLPASYTALYAISRMRDEEIEAALLQGVIHPRASSHTILSWAKQNRFKSGEAIPPWRCLVVFEQEIDRKDLSAMRFRMNEIAREYGAKLMSEFDYIPFCASGDDQKATLVAELEQKILHLATPYYERMTERERSNAGVKELENFPHVDILSFGYITRPEGDEHRLGRSSPRRFTPIYVYKVALEFLKTDSRSQRFNYKRRLMQLSEKQPELIPTIQEVQATYMKS